MARQANVEVAGEPADLSELGRALARLLAKASELGWLA
jgi:hypothetical protein